MKMGTRYTYFDGDQGFHDGASLQILIADLQGAHDEDAVGGELAEIAIFLRGDDEEGIDNGECVFAISRREFGNTWTIDVADYYPLAAAFLNGCDL